MKTLFLVIVGIALAFALSVEAKSSPSEDLTPQNEPDLGDIAEFKNAGTDLMLFCHHFLHHFCHQHYHHHHHWCHHFYPEGEAVNFKDIAEFKNAGTDLMLFCHHFLHHFCHQHYHHHHHWCHHFYPEGEAVNFKDSPAVSQKFESLIQELFRVPEAANN